ncbi:MAG: phosphoribosylglycinamide formyltransferase [Firmicutes bacterium]|nr:phosphoribosylglycinamide formyltransferase [Bacillota bacterium]
MLDKARIAVLVSGGGTNLQAIIDAQKSGIIQNGEVVLVVSNSIDAYALERARKEDIETEVILRSCYESREAFCTALGDVLEEKKIDLIVLAGFMCILTKSFSDRFKDRIINVHPSLIPSFCGEGFYGLKVHEEALKYGVKVSGATVHYVNEVPDGGKIIFQKAVEIEDGDTPEVLQRRIMEQAEWILLPRAVEKISKEIVEKRS